MLNNLEKIRIYRAIINAMKEEEEYNKRKNVLSAREVLDLSFKRYGEMLNVLEPLKKSLMREINVTNIYFAKDYQDETAIIIEYQDEEGKKFFTISEYDDGEIDFLFDIYNGNYQKILDDNRKEIFDAFKANREFNFERETVIPSTSKKFVVKEGSNFYGLFDSQEKNLKLSYNYVESENSKQIIVPYIITSDFKGVNELLKNEANVHNLFENVKVYEENVPKSLLKK